MNCPHCQRPTHRGPCQPSQAPLLPPPAAWRRELQQRVEAYRARQAAAGLPVAASAPPPAATTGNLVSFPTRLQQQASAEEPLAEPVVLASQPREAPEGATVRVLPPPPRPRPNLAPLPDTRPEASLAETVRVTLPRERTLLAASPQAEPSATFLQIPLPMAEPEAESPLPIRPAPCALRLRAGLMDAGVVLMGALLFAAAGWASSSWGSPGWGSEGLAQLPPHAWRPLLPAVAAVPFLLAALYLGLCSLAGGVTLGMRHQGLRVESFAGELTPQALRRRAWASLISLGALGLGFIWMYCDAQGLTWHDSISRTCVTRAEASAQG